LFRFQLAGQFDGLETISLENIVYLNKVYWWSWWKGWQWWI